MVMAATTNQSKKGFALFIQSILGRAINYLLEWLKHQTCFKKRLKYIDLLVLLRLVLYSARH
jgi:hypothetical protein